MDSRSNSRANTCTKARLVREGLCLLDQKPTLGVILIFIFRRMCVCLGGGEETYHHLNYYYLTEGSINNPTRW